MRKPEEKGGANAAGPCPARALLSAELRAQFGNLRSLPEAPPWAAEGPWGTGTSPWAARGCSGSLP